MLVGELDLAGKALVVAGGERLDDRLVVGRLSSTRRIRSRSVSMTVTFMPSVARCRAIVVPTWPAPQMTIRISVSKFSRTRSF